MNRVSGLDKQLQEVLTRPEFLEMRGVAKEVPIFIQTCSPADEDQLRVVLKGAEQFLRKQGLRVKHVDLFELVLQLLEALGGDTQISLITGSGRIYPFLRTHTILEALQPAMARHPVVVFFPGEYSQDADGGSYLRLFGTTTASKIENPHYRATNLDYYDIKSS